MRDPNRIKPLLAKIERIWQASPDLRLCQLIGNCFPQGDNYYREDTDLDCKLDETYPGKKWYRFTEKNHYEGEVWHTFIFLTEEEAETIYDIISQPESELDYEIYEYDITEGEIDTLVKYTPSGYMDMFKKGKLNVPVKELSLDSFYKRQCFYDHE